MPTDAGTAALVGRVACGYADYATAVDDGNEEALRSLVTDDVVLIRGGETLSGVEALLDVYRAHWAQDMSLGQHLISNVSAQRRYGDVHSRAYFRALFLDDESTRLVVGRYEDVWIDDGDRLRIAQKSNIVQRVLTLPAAP